MENQPTSDSEKLTAEKARQGARKKGMPVVLATSIAATLVAFIVLVIWAAVGFS